MLTTRRIIVLLAAVSVLVVGSGTAYVVLPPRQTEDILIPADDAAAEQVVRAYLAALDAHDCDTAQALMTKDGRSTAALWCHDIRSARGVEVIHRSSGRHAGVGVAGVEVTFEAQWRPLVESGFGDDDVITWGYSLIRDTSRSPWRISDQGTG